MVPGMVQGKRCLSVLRSLNVPPSVIFKGHCLQEDQEADRKGIALITPACVFLFSFLLVPRASQSQTEIHEGQWKVLLTSSNTFLTWERNSEGKNVGFFLINVQNPPPTPVDFQRESPGHPEWSSTRLTRLGSTRPKNPASCRIYSWFPP